MRFCQEMRENPSKNIQKIFRSSNSSRIGFINEYQNSLFEALLGTHQNFKILGTAEYRVPKEFQKLGTAGYQGNFRSGVPARKIFLGTDEYRSDKKFCVPMGTWYWPDEKFWVLMGTKFRFKPTPGLILTTAKRF